MRRVHGLGNAIDAFAKGCFLDVVLYSSRPFSEHGAILPGGDRIGVMQSPLRDEWFAFYVLRGGASGSTDGTTRDEAARAAVARAMELLSRNPTP